MTLNDIFNSEGAFFLLFFIAVSAFFVFNLPSTLYNFKSIADNKKDEEQKYVKILSKQPIPRASVYITIIIQNDSGEREEFYTRTSTASLIFENEYGTIKHRGNLITGFEGDGQKNEK